MQQSEPILPGIPDQKAVTTNDIYQLLHKLQSYDKEPMPGQSTQQM